MTTTCGEEGSSLQFSALSLRAPLPNTPFGAINDSNSIPGNLANFGSKGTSTPKPNCSLQSPSMLFPSPPFLFRMCVACEILRLTTDTRFTALVLLHRYAQAKENQCNRDEDWHWIGAMCIFLACKAEDEPRRLRDVINMAQMVLFSPPKTITDLNAVDKKNGVDSTGSQRNRDTQNDDDAVICMNLSSPPPLDDSYWESKKKAIETEQMVLRWLAFDCSVSHPHRAVFWILKTQIELSSSSSSKPLLDDKDKCNLLRSVPVPRKRTHDDHVAVAWQERGIPGGDMAGTSFCTNNYVKLNNGVGDKILPLAFRRLNDALFYRKALTWGVIELACAAMELAATDTLEQQGKNKSTVLSNGKSATVKSAANSDQLGIYFPSDLESIFGKDWCERYGVSNADMNACKRSLKEAKSFLETVGTVEAPHSPAFEF